MYFVFNFISSILFWANPIWYLLILCYSFKRHADLLKVGPESGENWMGDGRSVLHQCVGLGSHAVGRNESAAAHVVQQTQAENIYFLIETFFFFVVLRTGPKTLCMLGKCPFTKLHPWPAALLYNLGSLLCCVVCILSSLYVKSSVRVFDKRGYHYYGTFHVLTGWKLREEGTAKILIP